METDPLISRARAQSGDELDGLPELSTTSKSEFNKKLVGSLFLDSVPGWCIALGGTTALDTFGSQAFTGGTRPSDVSIHFQRCLLVLWALLFPICVLWANIEPVLLALGQEEKLSSDVQRIMRLSTLALFIVSPINIALNVVLVHHTSLQVLGSPLALSITYWLALVTLIILTACSPQHNHNKTWGGWRLRESLEPTGVWAFLKLALPGILMVGTEWAAFEIVALAAGRLGALSLAAQSVIMTTDQILNTMPFGIGVAASARVGNLIGARTAVSAKHAGHAAALLSVLVGTVVMVAMLAAKNVFGYIFSDDDEVVRLVGKVMPLVASFQVADGLAGSCGGVLRGQGRQHLGALFNLGAYYVLALPMGIALAFSPRTHMGLEGLWLGQVVALFIVGIGLYVVVWRGTDWEKEVQRGIERNKANDDAKRRYDTRRVEGTPASEVETE
ncbi:hypothetical protein EW145_g3322 [Phellinidium pouzarii]|uniref:Polysaccharide biosynthesis protein C-terminal domain-containing protein n=1 Tax=Phellinidium pouzarii TaxID=167371 RepID=A0A4S4L7H4_9AGAM|nr:hypothetical protein EW145_g3322 [Phellinidium pouzarii]